MTCRDLVDCMIDYFEDDLDAHTRARFHRHLVACPDCSDYLARYRETIQATAAAYIEVTPDAPEDLVQTILAARQIAGSI